MLVPSSIWPGSDAPLGATWDGHGVNFAVYSENATRVELCLFDDQGRKEVHRVDLRWNTEGVWHCYLPEARPGLVYGYRAHGPYEPARGHRFNPNKLLLDPYARDLVGAIHWTDALYGHRIGSRDPEAMDTRDSARHVPKARVVDPAFDWRQDRPLRIPLKDSVLYELHVRGFTMRHPDVPPALRGTYAGLATPPVIEHFKRLGVTALELLPVHAFLDEPRLVKLGLTNYWGYNSLAFFAPEPRYAATGNPVREFQAMVADLHDAGLEVLLDVVYNHTAEQGPDGPTLSFRGLDNTTWYRVNPATASQYLDFTGCGNSLDTRHPRVLQMIADSLRYWVEEMHIDGFRFDLASTLAREGHDHSYDPGAGLLDILRQDPVLSRVKLISEPWDVGPGGYQVGGFPRGWSEWNGAYRDVVRRFWRGDSGVLGQMAFKVSGSSDLYWNRSPQASINFVTAHDGFTLSDLVSYESKHNLANMEENRDGSNDNLSWNCGEEGVSSDPEVLALRARQQRNFLMTLFLSQGVPMLVAGDEMGRTQSGNNNAYCQDNEISWVDWNLSAERRKLLDFARQVVALRRTHPSFRRTSFFRGRFLESARPLKDVLWLSEHGREMSEADWNNPEGHSLGMYLAGDCLEGTDQQGRPILDSSFLLLMNSGPAPVEFRLPQIHTWAEWSLLLDTAGRSALSWSDRRVLSLPRSSAALLMEVPREEGLGR
jgi:glycogen operon protein